jgi:hypothetical protein
MKVAVLVGLVLLSACSRSPRDLSGQWVVSQDRDVRGNLGKPADCTFAQQLDTLTVRCSAAGVMTGQVHGMQVTWSVDMTNIPPIRRDHVILAYSGSVNGATDTIDGTWSIRSRLSGLDERGTFEAKRKSSQSQTQSSLGRPQ